MEESGDAPSGMLIGGANNGNGMWIKSSGEYSNVFIQLLLS